MARGRRAGRVRPAEPLRRCVGCRKQRPQTQLLRVAAQAGKAVSDPGRHLPGRGAWICLSAACAQAASKGRQISRALRGQAAEPSAAEVLLWVTGS